MEELGEMGSKRLLPISSRGLTETQFISNLAGVSLEPPSPPGLLVLGGKSTKEHLSSVESLGFEKCTLPSLPEERYSFGSFITPTEPEQLAACGGWWAGKPNSSDCLTLNITSGQWERGAFANGLLGDDVQGVINMGRQGVFMIHSVGMSVLAPDAESWLAGLVFATPAVCACNISRTNFVTIHSNSSKNVRGYHVTNNEVEPEPIDVWPSLSIARQGPACGATSRNLVVAGGVSDWDEVLTSVEVIHIATKAKRMGGNLQQARAFFQIIPVGSAHPRLLAIGGQGASHRMDTSEWWDEDEDSWEVGPPLATGRSNFAALMAPPRLVCLEMDPPDHSCPAEDQICTLSSARPGQYQTNPMPMKLDIDILQSIQILARKKTFLFTVRVRKILSCHQKCFVGH